MELRNNSMDVNKILRCFAHSGALCAPRFTATGARFIDDPPQPQINGYWSEDGYDKTDDASAYLIHQVAKGQLDSIGPVRRSEMLSKEGIRRFQELPGELRNRIYGFMLPTKASMFTSKREGDRKSDGVIFTTYEPAVHLEGFSLLTNKEWLSVLRAHLKVALGETGVEIWIQAPVEQSERSPWLPDEYCEPEDGRSPYHKDSVWYAKSVVGAHFALAADIMRARNNAYPWSGFSFDMGHIDNSASIVKDLAGVDRLSGPSVQQLSLDSDRLRLFTEAMMVGLSIRPAITVHLFIKGYVTSDVSFMDIVHDLRYVADNGFLDVTVCAYADDVWGWDAWLRSVGGSTIKWVTSRIIRPEEE